MKETYKILVDLDSILDTRLATLASMDIDVANEIGQTEEYRNRYSDNFSLLNSSIDDKLFKDRWLKRNTNILKNALMTDVVHLICMGLDSMLPSIERGVSPQDTRLVLNIYPYEISSKDLKYLEAAILYHIPFQIALDIVREDMYKQNPSYLSANYNEWYTYNIEPWIAIHQNTLLRRPMVNVQIVLPKLSTSGNDPRAESFDMEPFLARELLFKPYLSLNYVDLSYYSYNHGFAEYVKKSGFYDR